jgi:hypothetical protein
MERGDLPGLARVETSTRMLYGWASFYFSVRDDSARLWASRTRLPTTTAFSFLAVSHNDILERCVTSETYIKSRHGHGCGGGAP